MESKEGSARKEVEEELADLDSLLPELDNKVYSIYMHKPSKHHNILSV